MIAAAFLHGVHSHKLISSRNRSKSFVKNKFFMPSVFEVHIDRLLNSRNEARWNFQKLAAPHSVLEVQSNRLLGSRNGAMSYSKNYWLPLPTMRFTEIDRYVRRREIGRILKNIESDFRRWGPGQKIDRLESRTRSCFSNYWLRLPSTESRAIDYQVGKMELCRIFIKILTPSSVHEVPRDRLLVLGNGASSYFEQLLVPHSFHEVYNDRLISKKIGTRSCF